MSEGTAPLNLSPLQRAFIALEETRARLMAAEDAMRAPIAIVGLGCRLPGAADPEEFWHLLRDGREAIGPLPADRWDIEALYDPDPETEGRIATRAGGFLKDVRGFDPALFGITRREADGMDPQQRLLLEVAWESLEHAGYPPDRQMRAATGVYVGVAGSDYATMQIKTADSALLDGHFASGIAHSVISGRLSYLLGLQGPSLSVDTACSSSLVAVHLACQALRAGDCRMALAGGVNLILSPDIFIALSRARMLAPDGRCKAFDAAADGFARGEGCGIVVLKCLRDAVTDGDRVLAVIRGSAVNQDGASSGLTAPSGPAQRAVIREALERAGVEPGQVSYVEAHGTGTQLGDPLELRALQDVFSADRRGKSRLLIGSVKTNIGHVEAAAGVAGLIKLVLSLQHKQIPAHLNFTTPTAHIDWDAAFFEARTRTTPWTPIDGRRIAGLSSFGFSGTNVHMLVEEGTQQIASEEISPDVNRHLFVISANSQRALGELALRHAAALDRFADRDLADLCFTVATSRASLAHRAVMLTHSIDELRSQLQALAGGRPAAGLRTAFVKPRDPPRIAFVFSGQGSQYAGMAAALDRTQPIFRAALDRCAAVLDARLERPLRDVLFPCQGVASPIDETAYTQPAIFAVEYALTELWRHWGVLPDMVMGHSVGEYVAACVAGIMSLEDALMLVTTRGQLMQSLPVGGAMAAVLASEDEVAKTLRQISGSISCAAFNGPAQTVISGSAQAVQSACAAFTARGIRSSNLPVSHAFHSPLVEPILDAFERVVAKVPFKAPRIRFVSNVTGAVGDARELVEPAYWRRHVREPVRFRDGVLTLADLKPQACIEIGPQPVLLAFVQETLGEKAGDIAMIPTLRRSRPDADQLSEALGALFLAGASVDWRAVWSPAKRQRLDMPSYPFQREACWFRARPKQSFASGRDTGHPLLGVRLRSAAPDLVSFELHLECENFPFLRDHCVNDRVILPGTAFFELALAAGRAVFGEVLGLRDVIIAEPLVVGEHDRRIVQVLVRSNDEGREFEILSSDAIADDGVWRRHVKGRFGPATSSASTFVSLETTDAIQARCATLVSAAEHQIELASRGLVFGPSLLGLRAMRRRDGEALGEVALPPDAGAGDYLIHPALLDACLQVISGALPASATEAGRAYLPLMVEQIDVFRNSSGPVWSHVKVAPAGGGSLRGEVLVFDEAGAIARLTGITFRAAATVTQVDESSVYRTVWRSRDLASSTWVPTPTRLATNAAAKLDALFREHDIDRYDNGFKALEPWCAAWIVWALNTLGWRPAINSVVTAQELARTLGVAQRYERLLVRFLQILSEEGLLARTKDGWRVVAPVTASDPAKLATGLIIDHPSSRARISLAANCGADLAAILRGEVDPLSRLFPDGSTELAEALYRDAPESKAFNQLVRETVRDIAAHLPAARRLRILEVGGGTGGTTAWVAPVLPERTDYLFTDLGPSMIARARESFAAFSFMDFKVFDIERDGAEQGIGAGYDLILASNVIHATADLEQTLARLRGLLAPGGVVLMLEVAGDERWIDITFGLTEGWWRFSDRGLRSDGPLLQRENWLALLKRTGFEAEALNPIDGRTREVLLAARRPEDPAISLLGDWAFVSDATGVGSALAAKIQAAGGRVHTLATAGDVANLPKDLRGVIHLRALDIPALAAASDAAMTMQEGALGSLLHLIQALGRATFTAGPPRLWIAARGGQAVDDRSWVNPAQAPIWGMGRTAALEHSELRPTLIDLDPAAAVDADAIALFDCLANADVEDQVAIRNGSQFVPRLTQGAGVSSLGTVRLEASDSGVIDDLRLVPVARRAPGPLEVEVRVVAAGINFRDVMNAVAMRDDPEPLGGELAGRIVSVGEGVTNLAIGDHVVGLASASFATYATTAANLVAKIPDGVGFAEAATLPFCFMTAHHALCALARLAAGETVLIHAAAGGVGMAAIRIAQSVGARVFATAGSEEKRKFLKSLGVEAVFGSRDLAFSRQILALTGGRGVDVVLNSLAGEFIGESVRCLSPDGRFLEIGKREIWSPDQFRAARPLGKYFAIDLAAMRERDPDGTARLFDLVLAKVRAGDWMPLPVTCFPMTRAAEAFRFMAQAHHIGKVVLVEDDRDAASIKNLRPDGAYLVTGGLSGLGLLTAQQLVRLGARNLFLAGRRAPSENAKSIIAAMEAQGARVAVFEADMSQPSAIATVLAAINAGPAPLRGVVHSAGALQDGALLQQSWSRFAEPLAAKIAGAWALHTLTHGARLDFFVMYSSIASVLGSAGQANHSAANAFMDALAHCRRAEGLPALSISWGAWKEIGAAADLNIGDRVGARGVDMIASEVGLRALERLSADSAAHVSFFPVRWDVFLKGAATPSPFLSELGALLTSAPSRPAAGTPPAPNVIQAELVAATPAGRHELLLTFVAEHVARVTGAPDWREIDPRQPLNELGLDSLMAVDLRNRLGAGLGVGRTLPATLVFDHPTVEALVTYLARTIFGAEVVAPSKDQPSNEVIDDLSEEEIERLFAKRTRNS